MPTWSSASAPATAILLHPQSRHFRIPPRASSTSMWAPLTPPSTWPCRWLVTREELLELVAGYSVEANYRAQAERLHAEWDSEVERIYNVRHTPLPSQGELIGAVNELSDPSAIMVCAAGNLPGDLHKLWRARHPKNYHMEYGYSCMGYEIAGGMGAKMAAPEREVYVMVGDGSYLMMNSEIVTSIQEGYKLIIVLFDNSGFKSIGA